MVKLTIASYLERLLYSTRTDGLVSSGENRFRLRVESASWTKSRIPRSERGTTIQQHILQTEIFAFYNAHTERKRCEKRLFKRKRFLMCSFLHLKILVQNYKRRLIFLKKKTQCSRSLYHIPQNQVNINVKKMRILSVIVGPVEELCLTTLPSITCPTTARSCSSSEISISISTSASTLPIASAVVILQFTKINSRLYFKK